MLNTAGDLQEVLPLELPGRARHEPNEHSATPARPHVAGNPSGGVTLAAVPGDDSGMTAPATPRAERDAIRRAAAEQFHRDEVIRPHPAVDHRYDSLFAAFDLAREPEESSGRSPGADPVRSAAGVSAAERGAITAGVGRAAELTADLRQLDRHHDGPDREACQAAFSAVAKPVQVR
jgi:hypothetical protein